MNYRFFCASFCLLLLIGTCVAQSAVNSPSAPPVSYSSISELNQLLANLQQTSLQIQEDLTHLRIEKWKTDSRTKHQSDSDVESIQRNLQTALPGILGELKNSPENTAITFKLYRNLDALYDVMSSVVESTGAFGGKEEFQSIDKDLGSLEDSRHALADRMDKVATAKESEIGQLRAALQTARAEIPPKKTIVDDTQPPPAKKSTSHKRTASKPKPKPNSSQQKSHPDGQSPQQ
jgi:hypothetical protein